MPAHKVTSTLLRSMDTNDLLETGGSLLGQGKHERGCHTHRRESPLRLVPGDA